MGQLHTIDNDSAWTRLTNPNIAGDIAMREYADWTLGLGRYKGVHLRMHLFFFLFGAATLLFAWKGEQGAPPSGLMGLAGLSICILFISLLLHVGAHAVILHRLGGRGGRFVITPWGELGSVRLPLDPRGELAAILAGPFMNLALCLFLLPLLFFTSDTEILGLLHPFAPVNLVSGSVWLAAIKLAFWINSLLVIINLLPAYPFDGGHALVSLITMADPLISRQKAAKKVAKITRLAAFALLVVAFFSWNQESTALVPLWFALLLLALFLFFSTHQEEPVQGDEEGDDLLFGYDFSQGYTSLEQASESPPKSEPFINQWLSARREQRETQRAEIEQEEDRRMDEILCRIHEKGKESLSSEDKRLLNQVSARYRNRKSADQSSS